MVINIIFFRKSIADKKVPFIEVTPLALKNRVGLQASKNKDKACMSEMMEVIACLGKYDNQQSLCAKELTTFNNCYAAFKKDVVKKKAFKESGATPLGRFAQMDGPQMNTYMQKFMQSARTNERHPEKVYEGLDKYGFPRQEKK